ncbi:MAG: hypothetical protein DMD28_12250 [Gemmatimonadetes bacterium]|nr:MAG: hypothetical protein DMD28_12250 [Gemmatimonadota bacterium]
MSALQHHFTGSNGTTWQNMDTAAFMLTITPSNACLVVVGANLDLWTANAGLAQDVGISVLGGAYPTATGQPEAWKESGGYGGTYSPNAAYLHTVLELSASTTYTLELVWKTNKPSAGGSIYAGAGPIGSNFSPTRLTLIPIGC